MVEGFIIGVALLALAALTIKCSAWLIDHGLAVFWVLLAIGLAVLFCY